MYYLNLLNLASVLMHPENYYVYELLIARFRKLENSHQQLRKQDKTVTHSRNLSFSILGCFGLNEHQ